MDPAAAVDLADFYSLRFHLRIYTIEVQSFTSVLGTVEPPPEAKEPTQ